MDQTYDAYLRGFTLGRTIQPAATFAVQLEGKNQEERVAFVLGVHTGRAGHLPETRAKLADAVKRFMADATAAP